MIRVAALAIATTITLFALLGVVMGIGYLRLHSQNESAEEVAAATPAPAPTAGPPPLIYAAENPSSTDNVDEPGAESKSIYLEAAQGVLVGNTKLNNRKKPDGNDADKKGKNQKHHHKEDPAVWISGLHEPTDAVSWQSTIEKPGNYEIDLVYATPEGGGGTFDVLVADQTLHGKTEPTRNGTAFRMTTLSTVKLAAGPTTLTLKPAAKCKNTLMNLRGVKLIPAD